MEVGLRDIICSFWNRWITNHLMKQNIRASHSWSIPTQHSILYFSGLQTRQRESSIYFRNWKSIHAKHLDEYAVQAAEVDVPETICICTVNNKLLVCEFGFELFISDADGRSNSVWGFNPCIRKIKTSSLLARRARCSYRRSLFHLTVIPVNEERPECSNLREKHKYMHRINDNFLEGITFGIAGRRN